MPHICFIGPYPPPYGGMAIQLQTMAENLKKDGFNVTVIKANQDIPPFCKNLKGIRTVINFIFYINTLLKNIPSTDVVYILASSHLYFFAIVMPAVLLSNFYKKKTFINYRGGGPQDFFKKFRPLVRYIMKQTKITVPSGYLEKVIKDYLELNSYIVPNIAYLDLFSYRERNPLKPYFLCTRHFEPMYNIPCVVKAFKIITKKFPEAKLGLVGDGPERKKIVNLVKQLGINDKVKFYGKLPHKELPKIYDNYDIFINASNIDNFPGSIVEAFAAGLPVVSTNPGGIPYLVEDGKTGLLVNINNYEALAKKAIFLLENPQIAIQIARAARKESEKYQWKNVKKKLLEVISSY